MKPATPLSKLLIYNCLNLSNKYYLLKNIFKKKKTQGYFTQDFFKQLEHYFNFILMAQLSQHSQIHHPNKLI